MQHKFIVSALMLLLIAVEGQLQEDSTGCDGTVKGLDLVFVLDSSISIRRNRFELIRDLTKQISAELNISIDDSLVGVILISSKSTLHFSLNDHTNNSALRKALDEVPYLRSRTNTAAALRLLYNSALDGRLGIREGFPRVAIIVTDGLSDDVNATVRASEELHKLRIFTRVYAVGIEGAQIRELNTIASDPSFVAFTADFTPEGVEEVQQNVSLEVCIEENNVIGVAVPEDCESRGIDLVFVLDTSISIRKRRFVVVRELVRNIAASLDIGLTQSLVAVIQYSKQATLLFNLLEHTDKTSLLQAIDAIQFTRGRTRTDRALRLLLSSAQDGSMGLRDGHPHIAIIMTDGISMNRSETIAAATDLHDTRVYDKIISVGIANYRTEELKHISNDFVNLYVQDNFTINDVEIVQNNISLELCAEERRCDIEGQVFTKCLRQCVPTCATLLQNCSVNFTDCQEGCECPSGTVLDEIQNKCVPIFKCNCPPTCSHAFCGLEINKHRQCSRPTPQGTSNCPNSCHTTYCNACYYSPTPRRTPGRNKCIRKCGNELMHPECLQNWANCVEERDRSTETCTGDCITAENFRCYDFPPCN